MGVEEDTATDWDFRKGVNNLFLASTEYVNDLPNVSYDLKQFLYPFNLEKYSEYMTPQFAKNYVNDEFIGCDNAFGIDFLNMSKYKNSENQEFLDFEDMKLLVDTDQSQRAKTRTQNHTKNISWLRKTEYISAESVRNTKMSDLVDKKLIQNAETYKKCTDSYKSLNAQIDAINTTFNDSKVDPKLHAKKSRNVVPVQIIPILPITDLPSSCKGSHVSFDSHPTFYGSDIVIDQQDASNAILRGLSDESGDYVGYYIPRKIPVSLESTANCEKEQKYFQLLREYTWNINSKSSNMDMYAFSETPNSSTFEYMALPSKIKLNKRFCNRSTENISQGIPHVNLIVEEQDSADFTKDDQTVS